MRNLKLGVFIILVPSLVFALLKDQTNWVGGPGEPGPVGDWGTRFSISDSVTYTHIGDIYLKAIFNASGWVYHKIDSSASIDMTYFGLQPVDIDNDGVMEVLGYKGGVYYYERTPGGWTFTPNLIGFMGGAMYGGCVTPAKINSGSSIDVVAASGAGLAWFNNNGSWTKTTIAAGYWHNVVCGDVDHINGVDIVADSGGDLGDVYLFKNNGSGIFTQTLAYDWGFTGTPFVMVTRSALAYLNNDSWLDLVSRGDNVMDLLWWPATSAGAFTETYSYPSGGMEDGMWPSDINDDGYMDIIVGSIGGNIYALLNDGTGTNFTYTNLVTSTGYYGDGTMSRDIDLDGLTDIVTSYNKVGWLRQYPYMTFNTYDIYTITGSTSHWVYAANADSNDEVCTHDIDIFATWDGVHAVFENRMMQANPLGSLTSSILRPSTAKDSRFRKFGWEACVPTDTSLAFYWRVGNVADIGTKDWNGPFYDNALSSADSINIDTTCLQCFQYKVELRGGPDIAILYKVWVRYDECDTGAGVEENKLSYLDLELKIMNRKILFSTPTFIKDASIDLFDISGRMVEKLYNGSLDRGIYTFTPETKKKGIYLVLFRSSANTLQKKLLIP